MAWQFCGQALSARELELIVEVTGSCTGVSRTELAATVCELLGWRRANGRLKSRGGAGGGTGAQRIRPLRLDSVSARGQSAP